MCSAQGTPRVEQEPEGDEVVAEDGGGGGGEEAKQKKKKKKKKAAAASDEGKECPAPAAAEPQPIRNDTGKALLKVRTIPGSLRF